MQMQSRLTIPKRCGLAEENDKDKGGRPPVGGKGVDTHATQIRIAMPIYKRIVAIAGPRGLSAFIRSAIDSELRKRERGKG